MYKSLWEDTRPRRVQQDFLAEVMSKLRQEGWIGYTLWGFCGEMGLPFRVNSRCKGKGRRKCANLGEQ